MTRTDLLLGNRVEATCEMCHIKQLIRYSSYFFFQLNFSDSPQCFGRVLPLGVSLTLMVSPVVNQV